MMHFRGLPNATYTAWFPVCSTPDKPVEGDVTTDLHGFDCPDCMGIVKPPHRKHWSAAEDAKRAAARKTASEMTPRRECVDPHPEIDRKQKAAGET